MNDRDVVIDVLCEREEEFTEQDVQNILAKCYEHRVVTKEELDVIINVYLQYRPDPRQVTLQIKGGELVCPNSN